MHSGESRQTVFCLGHSLSDGYFVIYLVSCVLLTYDPFIQSGMVLFFAQVRGRLENVDASSSRNDDQPWNICSNYNQNINTNILTFTLLYSFSVSRVLRLFLNFSWFCKGSALSEQINESLLRTRMKVSKAQRPEGKSYWRIEDWKLIYRAIENTKLDRTRIYSQGLPSLHLFLC